MSAFTAVFDACVLAPAPLRDLLVELSGTGIFRGRWTNAIHDEWIAAVKAFNPQVKDDALQRTRQLMDAFVLDACVQNYEGLIPALELPDSNDRHVLAAAITCGADLIVTFNIRDFPMDYTRRFGVEPCHPDEFLQDLLDMHESTVLACVRRIRARLVNPPKTAEELLAIYRNLGLIATEVKLREMVDAI